MSENFCEVCQCEFDLERDGSLHVHQGSTVYKCGKCLRQFPSKAECMIHYWEIHGAAYLLRDPGAPVLPPPPSTIQEVETNGGRLGAD